MTKSKKIQVLHKCSIPTTKLLHIVPLNPTITTLHEILLSKFLPEKTNKIVDANFVAFFATLKVQLLTLVTPCSSSIKI